MKKTVHYGVDYKHGEDSSVSVMAYVWPRNDRPDDVSLTIHGGNFSLNESLEPKRARQLADALLKAADQVEAWAKQEAVEVPQ